MSIGRSPSALLPAGQLRWLTYAAPLLIVAAGIVAGFLAMLRYLDAPQRDVLRPVIVKEEFFTAGASSTKMLRSGWAQPEAWGTWSLGARAVLVWKLEAEPLDSLELTVDGRTFLPPGGLSQVIHVEVNGSRVGTIESTPDGRLRNNVFAISRRVATQTDPMTIAFLIARPTSPEEMKHGSDNRKIGIGLTSAFLRY